MQQKELYINCPLCEERFLAGKYGVKRHIKRNHKGMTKSEYISLLRSEAKRGKQVADRVHVRQKYINPYGKTAFNTGATGKPRYVRVVLGGAIDLGKKR